MPGRWTAPPLSGPVAQTRDGAGADRSGEGTRTSALGGNRPASSATDGASGPAPEAAAGPARGGSCAGALAGTTGGTFATTGGCATGPDGGGCAPVGSALAGGLGGPHGWAASAGEASG
eukprot:5658772-Alexandrium_andersonii.AAC.1